MTSIDDVILKDCKRFIPNIKYGKVVKVYDGDTITIATKFMNDDNFYKFSVRLRNIDTPELRSKDSNERLCAKCARHFLAGLILNTVVTLKNVDYDKYGRILADIYLEETNICDVMIKEKVAIQYSGGKKNSNFDWYTFYNENEWVKTVNMMP